LFYPSDSPTGGEPNKGITNLINNIHMKNSLKNVYKVPLGGFRGGFMAELVGCYQESCRRVEI
jgi:hypothetical protein